MIRTVALTALLLASPALAAEDYRVVLRDGSWVRVLERPSRGADPVPIRLKSGQLTRLDEARIDWAVTDAWNRSVERAARASAPGGGSRLAGGAGPSATDLPSTITIIGEPERQGPVIVRPDEAGRPPPPAEAPPALEALRERIAALEAEIEALGTRQRDLEGRLRRNVYLDRRPELERQIRDVEGRVAVKRKELGELIRSYAARSRR